MPKRTDGNHDAVVHDLRKMGCAVLSLASLGKGAPDLLVGWKGRCWAFEVKNPLQPPSKCRLTPDEREWHALWEASGGQVDVIYSAEDAARIMSIPGRC